MLDVYTKIKCLLFSVKILDLQQKIIVLFRKQNNQYYTVIKFE